VKRSARIQNWLSYIKIFIVLKKNNRTGSAVVFGIKACRCNMTHRTLAE
jgi:hypothetical protein